MGCGFELQSESEDEKEIGEGEKDEGEKDLAEREKEGVEGGA